MPRAEDQYRVYPVGAQAPIRPRLLEGHHRLFAAKLFGVRRLRLELSREPAVIPDLPGRIEDASFDGVRLRIEGWITPGSPDVQCFEIRSRDRPLCRGLLAAEAEAAATARTAGGLTFSRYAQNIMAPITAYTRRPPAMDTEVPSALNPIETLDVMVLSNWLPVGKLSTTCRRG